MAVGVWVTVMGVEVDKGAPASPVQEEIRIKRRTTTAIRIIQWLRTAGNRDTPSGISLGNSGRQLGHPPPPAAPMGSTCSPDRQRGRAPARTNLWGWFETIPCFFA